MVFFSAVFAARAPAMGNSADRAWQPSQLMEGVLTACNPSHGSLSCVQARLRVSKQIGRHDAACQGCPRRVSRSPEARLPGPRARRALFPTCGVICVAGYSVVWNYDPTPISPKEHQKERCDHFRPQRSFITFHGALRNILLSAGFPVTIHMIALEQTFANDSLQKIFSC